MYTHVVRSFLKPGGECQSNKGAAPFGIGIGKELLYPCALLLFCTLYVYSPFGIVILVMMMRRPLVLALSWLFLFLDSNGVHADSAKQQQTPTRGVPLPTARDVLREKFPSGLKIDRFSASWPQSSASFMSDLLEGAAAREWLERQQGSKKKGRTTSNKNNQVATTLPPRSFPSPQSAKKSSDKTKESGLSPRGLLYVPYYQHFRENPGREYRSQRSSGPCFLGGTQYPLLTPLLYFSITFFLL